MAPLQYANDLWMETLCCPRVYDEYVLKGTVVEGLRLPVIHKTKRALIIEKQQACHIRQIGMQSHIVGKAKGRKLQSG